MLRPPACTPSCHDNTTTRSVAANPAPDWCPRPMQSVLDRGFGVSAGFPARPSPPTAPMVALQKQWPPGHKAPRLGDGTQCHEGTHAAEGQRRVAGVACCHGQSPDRAPPCTTLGLAQDCCANLSWGAIGAAAASTGAVMLRDVGRAHHQIPMCCRVRIQMPPAHPASNFDCAALH